MCSLLLLASSAPSANAYVGYPSSIAVSPTPERPARAPIRTVPALEVRANSWATGTNPAVKSLYLRMLAVNPRIEGHNFNLAQGGADVHDLVRQATGRRTEPKPRPVLIQIMDDDIVCPAPAHDFTAFRSTFVRARSARKRRARVEHLRRQPVRKPLPRPGRSQRPPNGGDSAARAVRFARSPRPARPEGSLPGSRT